MYFLCPRGPYLTLSYTLHELRVSYTSETVLSFWEKYLLINFRWLLWAAQSFYILRLASDWPELELQVVVGCLEWALGTEIWSFLQERQVLLTLDPSLQHCCPMIFPLYTSNPSSQSSLWKRRKSNSKCQRQWATPRKQFFLYTTGQSHIWTHNS